MTYGVLKDLSRRDLLQILKDHGFEGDEALFGIARRVRYSIHINGPWCITFDWQDSDALRVNFGQYH